MRLTISKLALSAALAVLGPCVARADYTNFEASHVHPITLTPSGNRLLVVNTPDGLVEVFDVELDGSLSHDAAIRVGLEPVTVRALDDTTAWVVNNLSDTISIVDLAQGVTTRTLQVGNEPTDVVFAQGKAFVAVSEEDLVRVYTLSNLDAAPVDVPLRGRDVRSLAVSVLADDVYAVVLKSGNETTVVNANIIAANTDNADPVRLSALGLRDLTCSTPPPPYPPLPGGITRDASLPDPPPDPPAGNQPIVSLIVKWNSSTGQWEDESGQNWNDCLPYTVGDHDLFVIDATSYAVTEVDHLGTSIFSVSVNPDNDRIYVANTDARNFVRFEHPLGVQGHMVDNRLSIVDPTMGNQVTVVDLNSHINRASDPSTNLAERVASISQPGMMVWKADGTEAYLTAIGSRKVFKVDGSCLTSACIFGSNRATPDAVEAGEGPSGVALHESRQRLYVLNRISHSIAIVSTSPSLSKLDEIPLHDPSSQLTRDGRRFLYDAIDTSGHGDAACASCHLSGDNDGLAWDLGDPTGTFTPYSKPFDNIRFIGVGGLPCTPGTGGCTQLTGFDPQKGPMTTQTLRGMLEPLHWRGDRETMNAFNKAFVGLMGAEDIGPINNEPAGLPAQDMELFRQFSLAITFPPNPYREVDDTLPCPPRSIDPLCEVQPLGLQFPGNPADGELLFDTGSTDGGGPCVTCHTHPFGAGGGTLGGVDPEEPTSMNAAAMFIGVLDQSIHSDLKIPHLRNMHEKFGPVWAAPGDGTMPETVTSFGFSHDGAVPDLFRFLSINVFTLSAANQAQQVRDLASFMFHFPTGTKPAAGRQVTVPQGMPPTGSIADEALLTTLTTLGDLTDANRHCELTAATLSGGRARAYHLSGGSWVTDASAEPPVATNDLRQNATAPITFTCATLGSGPRLGGNRDEDVVLDGDDCAAADADTWMVPVEIDGLGVERDPATLVTWTEQASVSGPSMRYDVVGGLLSDLRSMGLAAATACLAGDVDVAQHEDQRPDPLVGDGYFYLTRAENPCALAGFGSGREALDLLACTAP